MKVTIELLENEEKVQMESRSNQANEPDGAKGCRSWINQERGKMEEGERRQNADMHEGFTVGTGLLQTEELDSQNPPKKNSRDTSAGLFV